ncbi:hypothetical protein, partial [Microcoleus sp. Aus8_D4]|uniref:hypothetical protein n=1 Tax=Microcoleus sp. Aus8_D4 TaxID=2818634 RepID=UPI002FCE7CAC
MALKSLWIHPQARRRINSPSHSPSELKLTSCSPRQLGIFRGAGRVYLSCLLPSMFVGEPAPTVNW